MTIFKSKGMQWRHAYTLGDVVKKENKKIAYYNPETFSSPFIEERLYFDMILFNGEKIIKRSRPLLSRSGCISTSKSCIT